LSTRVSAAGTLIASDSPSAKLDDIGAVALRTLDHDAVLAARRSHTPVLL